MNKRRFRQTSSPQEEREVGSVGMVRVRPRNLPGGRGGGGATVLGSATPRGWEWPGAFHPTLTWPQEQMRVQLHGPESQQSPKKSHDTQHSCNWMEFLLHQQLSSRESALMNPNYEKKQKYQDGAGPLASGSQWFRIQQSVRLTRGMQELTFVHKTRGRPACS